jgi:hypothetical protein
MNEKNGDSGRVIEQLKRAFCKDDAGTVRNLLQEHPEAKALINEPIGPFDSPAINAARSPEMLDVLLEAGADINAKSRWWAGGFGILDGAEPDLARYAIERGAIVDVHAAARLGMIEKLKELVGTDKSLVHARGGDGQMPLHFASTIPIAEFLLGNGADIDALDVDHESTPAQWMVKERQEVARFLVSRGCKTDVLMAAALGDIESVKRHLRQDPECVWMEVSERYFPKKNPRAGGAIYTWTLGAAKMAHEVARDFGHHEVFNVLMEASPDPLKLVVASDVGNAELVARLRADGVRPPDQAQRRIADAARNNKTETVRLMLEAGWPVDARGQHGGMPLHWAGFHGNSEMAKVILARNPPLEVVDHDFKSTPLGWAIHGSTGGWERERGDYAGTVEALLGAGAKPPSNVACSQQVEEVLLRHRKREA